VEKERQVTRLSLVLSLLFLFGCVTDIAKPEVTNTSVIRASNAKCGPTSILKKEISRLGESLNASALMKIAPSETVIVSFFSSQDGEWTVIIDGVNGISCMILWGKYWTASGQKS
jgi:hypothetical protein